MQAYSPVGLRLFYWHYLIHHILSPWPNLPIVVKLASLKPLLSVTCGVLNAIQYNTTRVTYASCWAPTPAPRHPMRCSHCRCSRKVTWSLSPVLTFLSRYASLASDTRSITYLNVLVPSVASLLDLTLALWPCGSAMTSYTAIPAPESISPHNLIFR